LISDGTVTCWGWGADGQLGTGNNNNSNVPVAVTGGALANKTVTQIDTGYAHTCALISDGTVTCWGWGASGQLGTGNNNSNTPVAVTGGALANKTVTQIATGGEHTCALISDGTVACWGNGAYGQLGTGDNNNSNIPVAVTGGALANKTVTQIATGGARIATGGGHTCALISDGTVTCWGWGNYGQLGAGDTNDSNIPVEVTGGALANKTVTQIATGNGHTCALISDGTVTCWGWGPDGQLGTGNNNNSNIPVAVTGGALANETVTQIATGGGHTCALISDGTVTCWGWGGDGRLGTGNNNNSNIPVAVTGGALANKTVTQIATSNIHTCALISDGTVTCWGSGGDGQLGTGNNNDSNVPVAIVWPVQAVNTVRPTITGQARVGKRLTVNKGTWTGTPTPKFTRKWYACTAKVARPTQTIPGTCQLIVGATKATFKLTTAQKNKFIAVRVTGRSRGTTATSWLSKTSAKVR
jgi:alpha-tubulin suppressor-like RCC1 family protein